jgi:uncharacterized protein (TIGR00645 family)
MTAKPRFVETILFAGRLLLVPMYLAMLLLLAMLVVFFLSEVIHAAPHMLAMDESDLVLLTLTLIDLSLTANLVVLVIVAGYENFVREVILSENDTRPGWMLRINFTGLKLKLLGSITVIAAVHLLRSFLDIEHQDDRALLWQVIVVLVFAVLGLLLAATDRLAAETHD